MEKKFNREYKYCTRGAATGVYKSEGYLVIPEMKTALGNKGIMVRGPKLWNLMPQNLRIFTGNITSFKRELKKWIRSNVDP